MISNDPKTYELFGAIAKLLKKYGKDTFLDLATMLRNPDFPNQVAEILENTAKVRAQRKQTKKRLSAKEEQMQFRESLAGLREIEPEKSAILLSLFDSLQAKTILPSLRALTDFISDQGLPVPKAKSRDKVAVSFLRRCTGFSLVDLQALADKVSPQQHSKDADRSLAGWGRIILDNKTEKS